MTEQTRKLLFTASPKEDESLVGYLLRLTELNYFNRLSWLLDAGKLAKALSSKTTPGINSLASLDLLAQITGVEEGILRSLAYRVDPEASNKHKPRYYFYDISLPYFFVYHRYSRICPSCLKEDNYLRRIWEYAPVTVCLKHQCLLIDSCPACQDYLIWNRSQVSKCFCGFDWRDSVPIFVTDKELRVTRQIYLLSQIEKFDENSLLAPHLQRLNLKDFFQVLLFFASAVAGMFEVSGKTLLVEYTNAELHHYLNAAAIIFDDFPGNFFVFLNWRKSQHDLNIVKVRQVLKHPESQRLKDWQSIFEAFRISLAGQFAAPQFSFIFKAFDEYLRLGEKGYGAYPIFYQDPQVLSFLYNRLRKSNESIVNPETDLEIE